MESLHLRSFRCSWGKHLATSATNLANAIQSFRAGQSQLGWCVSDSSDNLSCLGGCELNMLDRTSRKNTGPFFLPPTFFRRPIVWRIRL